MLSCWKPQYSVLKCVAPLYEKQKALFPPLVVWIALICSGISTRCHGIKGSPARQKRLPFWPSIEFWSSCSFLSSEQIKHSQTCWMEWEKQFDFSERSYKQNWDGHLPLSLSGWHLPLFAELFFFSVGVVGMNLHTSRLALSPSPVPLLLLLFSKKKVFIFPFSFWSLYFRKGKSYSLWSFYFFSKILTPFVCIIQWVFGLLYLQLNLSWENRFTFLEKPGGVYQSECSHMPACIDNSLYSWQRQSASTWFIGLNL